MRDTTLDDGLAARIARKRQGEVERRAKLFDPRTRQLGVNHAVLDAQLEEKRQRAEREAAEEAFHANNVALADQVAQMLDDAKNKKARERQQAVVEYSLNNLRKDQRREWHLSGPHVLSSDLPARTSDDDPRCGAASMQRFEGEDLRAAERKKMEQNIQRQWLLDQMAEKAERARVEKAEACAQDIATLTANEVRNLCEQATIQELRESKMMEAQENLEMARSHRVRHQAAKQADAEADMQHTLNHRARMTEVSDCPRRPDGKLVRTDFKRWSVEEEHEVYLANRDIVMERQAARRRDDERERWHAANMLKGVGVLGAVEEERARETKALHQQMVVENMAAAEAKRKTDVEEKRKYLQLHP